MLADRCVTDRPLGSFWWKSVLKLVPRYKHMAKATIEKGNSITAWQDDWGASNIKEIYPELYSFTLNHHISIREFTVSHYPFAHFYTPLSEQAFQHF